MKKKTNYTLLLCIVAFLLADQGYDVWLGNVRGNSYCRSHVKLSPRNRDFWQFR